MPTLRFLPYTQIRPTHLSKHFWCQHYCSHGIAERYRAQGFFPIREVSGPHSVTSHPLQKSVPLISLPSAPARHPQGNSRVWNPTGSPDTETFPIRFLHQLGPSSRSAQPAITLVGEPRMGGRGLRCRKSGSLGEPRSGRQDCSPGHGWGALAWGGLKVAPRGSVGGLGSLGRTTWKSDRLGALCRRQPSPVVREECSGTEEPEDRNRTGQAALHPQVPQPGTPENIRQSTAPL